ncbi:MAG: YggS family pyridoxal phosphate-dependent enzyme [Spirochaetia bacterium]|nr:YggS family pyridoxal phosphate-dependent enzyme [Spirochaetia bacterium]
MADMTENYGFVQDKVLRVLENIDAALRRSGREPSSVTLLAVTKFHPQEAVLAAYAAGIRAFGENRVQESMLKFDESFKTLIPGAHLHLIGTLQSNKINKALGLFDCIQSVDSEELLLSLTRKAAERDRKLEVMLELHTGEASKAGFPDTDTMLHAVESSLKMNSEAVKIKGLMTMAPYTDDIQQIRASFRKLASALKILQTQFGLSDLKELSMGMSNDYEIAVEEGATIVRIGTAIFGERA